MKKLFTIDDIMVAIVSALGYGFGATIAKLSGWSEPMCLVACIVLGLVVGVVISKIAFSETVQKSPRNRVVTYVACLLIFLIGQYISTAWMGVSMVDYAVEQLLYVVIIPIVAFVVTMLVRGYRAWKIRERYGDGSEGYVFDVKDADVEETNQQNQPILGEYDADCAVKTRTGIYVGGRYKGTSVYLGIPYAKPPVGELRWKAPEPLPPSEAVFEAKHFGASAIQVEHKGAILRYHRQSEDCLSLNVCVKNVETERKRPVLVLFHHGDFTYGGSADPLLYGNELVSKHPDIVVVSFNYRLGIFGFIDFTEVPGGEAYPDALNLGLLDQIAALRWIKENIAAFGGDPNRITVVGFESGAISISLLAASEQAKGLFHRAFVFFGSPEFAFGTPKAARALAKDLLKETQTTTMEELLRLETESLKDASQKLWLNMCVPTCDGTWIPADAYRAYKDGSASGIEFIFGIPNNERQVFRSFVGGRNYEDFVFESMADMQGHIHGPVANAVQGYIETQAASLTELDAKSELIEQWAAYCVYRTAKNLSKCGNTVHLMYWNQKPLLENLGSGTVDVAAVLLGNVDALQMYGNVMDEDVSEVLQSLLKKFLNGDALQLYRHEIKGVEALDWEAFPLALIVSDDGLVCDAIEERLR